LQAVNLHAAGIDIGAEEHWVAVPVDADPDPVRAFPAHTAGLLALAAWLAACGITTVALESTGVYWIPLFELLETRGFEVILVDPGTMPRNGRPKTDVHDCQWLQRLHTLGLLTAAFRPEDPIVVLRSYLRLRLTLLADAARYVQHMQKALTQMNVKLQHVVSDIAGKTGLDIIQAILDGVRDPQALAELRDRRCKEDQATIAQAL
jgi:transposase